MSVYQGDTHTFACSVLDSTGAVGTVTTAPLITIFRASDNTPMITSQAMTAVTGAAGLYLYRWTPANTAVLDDYIALVSYVTSLKTATNQFLELLRVGDTRITDVVARDATVAKDATVAHESTVAHSSDIANLNPATNVVIQSIVTKVNALPADPASNTQLLAQLPYLEDIRDYVLGTWTINKTVTPNVLSLFRANGSLMKTFQVYEDASTAHRQA